MMRTIQWIPFLFILLCQSSSFGQKIDSLKSVIITSSDTTKSNAFHQLGGSYEKARSYYNQLENQEKALNQLDINVGVAYFFAGDLGKALENYLLAYEDAKELGLADHEAKLVNNIAIIYRRSKKYDEALKYYHESIKIKRRIGDDKGHANTLMNIGLLHSQQERVDSAIAYLQQSEAMMKRANNPITDRHHVRYALGDIYFYDSQYEKAENVLSYFDSINYPGMEPLQKINGKIMLGTIFQNKEDHIRALEYFNECMEFLEERIDVVSLEKAYRKRSKSLYAIGQTSQAYEDLDSASQLLNEIKSDEKLRLESEMQTKYSTLQKEQEIALLSAESENQALRIAQGKRNLFYAITGLGFLFIMIIIILRNRNKIERLNSDLKEKNAIIEKSLKEKDTLLREIHHRVKNNLQVISSLLGIQSRSVKDEAAINALKEGRTRVQSMSLIHQDLYKHDNLKGINIKEYFEKLIKGIFETYKISNDDIEVRHEVQEMTLDVDTAIPLGLILNELITNSLKYAFQGGRGEIDISLKSIEDQIILKVSDNGVGMGDADEIIKSESYGYDLIHALIDQLDGNLNLSMDKGCKVEVSFKNYEKAA
jgi:two-component sensor histidine kinase